MPHIPTHTNYKWIRTIKKKSYSDPVYAKLYNSKMWRRLRLKYIQYNPLCITCKSNNIIKEGEVVDHIKPIIEGGSFEEWSNLQTLCKSCHAKKTGTETSLRNKKKIKKSTR